MENYTKKRLAEFEKEFAHVRETDRHYDNPWIPEMKYFLTETIQQAVAEERDRVREILIDGKRYKLMEEEI